MNAAAHTFTRALSSLRTRKLAVFHVELTDAKSQTWIGWLSLGRTNLHVRICAGAVEIVRAEVEVFWGSSRSSLPDALRAATPEERNTAETALAWIWPQVSRDLALAGEAARLQAYQEVLALAATYPEISEALLLGWA